MNPKIHKLLIQNAAVGYDSETVLLFPELSRNFRKNNEERMSEIRTQRNYLKYSSIIIQALGKCMKTIEHCIEIFIYISEI